jgi:hypothetical protein
LGKIQRAQLERGVLVIRVVVELVSAARDVVRAFFAMFEEQSARRSSVLRLDNEGSSDVPVEDALGSSRSLLLVACPVALMRWLQRIAVLSSVEGVVDGLAGINTEKALPVGWTSRVGIDGKGLSLFKEGGA